MTTKNTKEYEEHEEEKQGANPNAVDDRGRTALHLMLKKGSDLPHFEMLARYGARGDIA